MKYGNTSDSDTERNLLEILAEALCAGSVRPLQSVMSENCIYHSEFSGTRRYGSKNIIAHISEVCSNLDETTQYRYALIPASEEIREAAKDDLPGVMKGNWCFRLWQDCEGETPVAIVFIRYNNKGQITNILLGRNQFCLKTYAAGHPLTGVPKEYPAVDSLLRRAFGEEDTLSAMRRKDLSAADQDGVYVWQKSDRYVRDWLRDNSYRVDSSELFDDCIGYACTRRGVAYAVYMFAYGERKTSLLDGDYCAKLREHELSKDRTILVVYLHVTAEKGESGDTVFYVGAHDTKDRAPDAWELGWIGTQSSLLFYPRKELMDLCRRFMAAFNSQRLDVLKAIFSDGAEIDTVDGCTTLNDAVYSFLAHCFNKYGVMKTAFVRFNDVVYCLVPYIDDFCYISLLVSRQDRIERITFCPLDENYRELIVTEDIPMRHPVDEVPLLENVAFLPASERSRFSMLLTFANGETRRYDLPVQSGEDGGIVGKDAAFTDEIFRSGRIADPVSRNDAVFYRRYPQHYQGVEFCNGICLSTVELYHGSYPVGRFHYNDGTEVFAYDSDSDFTVGNIFGLDPADPLYLLDTKNKIAVTLPEQYQQTPVVCYPPCGGCSDGMVMVSTMGELTLQYHHNRYACAGMWGWLDTDLNTIIEPQYVYALNFYGGRAIVCKGEWDVREVDGELLYWCENEQWGIIDRSGKEVVPCKYDELYAVGNTDRLYFVHEGGWEGGHYAVFDVQEQQIILALDFDFDIGYMFNECFVANHDILVFANHLPGKGEDLIYLYDLREKKYIAYAEHYSGRTFNGKRNMTVTRDGKEIIVC